MTNTDGASVRINGPVQFRPGFNYTGFGRVCRAELVPLLNSQPQYVLHDVLRYVTYNPGMWFVFFSQFGRYYWVKEAVPTGDIGRYIDTGAFRWRKRRTNTFWVTHPLDIWDTLPSGQPYTFTYGPDVERSGLSVQGSGFVYFVEAVGMDRVRIGWTASPDRRPNELVRHSPSPLNLLALLPGEKADEAHLQFALSQWRLHDDWFQLANDVREYIQMLQRRWRAPGDYPARQIELNEPVGAQGVPV